MTELNHIREQDIKDYQVGSQLTLREFNLFMQLKKFIDLSANIVDEQHVFRITPEMLSLQQKNKILNAIVKIDMGEDSEIKPKDGLYQVYHHYADAKAMGYLLYKSHNTMGMVYYFDNEFKILAYKSFKSSEIKLQALQISPTDWLKIRNEKYNNIETVLDKEFVDRTNFENFTIDQLNSLEKKLSKHLKQNPNQDKLRAQLATLLMQKLPNKKRLQQSLKLFDSISSNNILEEYEEIKHVVRDMLRPQSIKSSITRVNWGVYNRCPLTCLGCYNIFNSNVLPLDQCKAILDKIVDSGVTELIISGGDPLLWPDLVEFCKYAKSKGLKIGIDTVSYNLNPHLLYHLKDLIAYIGVPLDGIDQKTIEVFRRGKADLLDKILHSLSIADSFDVPVRLNTTVNKKNIGSLEDIAQIVKKYRSIKTWSIYQWWPLRSGDKLIDQMLLDKEIFKQATSVLKNKYPELMIYDRTIDDRALNTFFISSNGEVYTFGNSPQVSTIIIGDIKTQTIAEILQSPALKKTSQKFMSIERFNTDTPTLVTPKAA